MTQNAAGFSRFDLTMLVLAPLAVGLFTVRRWYRLEDAIRRPRVLGPPACVLLFVLLLILAQLGVASSSRLLEATLPADDRELPRIAARSLGQYAAMSIGAVAFAVLALRAGPVADDGRPSPVRAGALGAAALLLLWPITFVVGWLAGLLAGWWRGEPVDPVAHETLRLVLESEPDLWLGVLIACVVVGAPVVEELMYRGLVQETLRRCGLGPWPAILAASVIFGLMHLSVTAPHAVVALVVLSMGFGWIYERTGRLAASIVMHALFNAGNLALALLSGGS